MVWRTEDRVWGRRFAPPPTTMGHVPGFEPHLIVYPHLPEGLLLKARRCSPGWLSVQPSLQARAYALGSPVIGCSALGTRAWCTNATPLADGVPYRRVRYYPGGESRAMEGHPCRGARRNLDQQLGRTTARDWAGRTGRRDVPITGGDSRSSSSPSCSSSVAGRGTTCGCDLDAKPMDYKRRKILCQQELRWGH